MCIIGSSSSSSSSIISARFITCFEVQRPSNGLGSLASSSTEVRGESIAEKRAEGDLAGRSDRQTSQSGGPMNDLGPEQPSADPGAVSTATSDSRVGDDTASRSRAASESGTEDGHTSHADRSSDEEGEGDGEGEEGEDLEETDLDESSEEELEDDERPDTPEKVREVIAFSAERYEGVQLDLSKQRLEYVPRGTWDLPLGRLNLSRNRLRRIPGDGLPKVGDLEFLNVSYNRLTGLPPSISALIHLQTLQIEHNKLTSLPDALFVMPVLVHVSADYNELTELPHTISGAHVLEKLTVSFNKISHFPEEMDYLPKLHTCNIEGNPVSFCPRRIRRLDSKFQLLRSKTLRRQMVRRALNVRSNVRDAVERELMAEYTDPDLQLTPGGNMCTYDMVSETIKSGRSWEYGLKDGKPRK